MDSPARSPLARSFERHLRAQNRSESTIAAYLKGLRQAEAFLRDRPDRARCADGRDRAAIRPTTLEAATHADLEAFMVDLLARGRAPGTAATYYKVLKVLSFEKSMVRNEGNETKADGRVEGQAGE